MLKEQTQKMSIRFFFYAVVSSIFLICIGFLTTTSMFHFVNFEYQKFVPQLQEKVSDLNLQITDLRKEGRALIAEGNKVGLNLQLRSDSSYSSKQDFIISKSSNLSNTIAIAEMSKNTTKDDINVGKKRDEVRIQFYTTQSELDNRYEDLGDINKSIEQYSTESNNAYLVTRALALGALGALITSLGRGSLQTNTDQQQFRYSTRDLTTSLIIGAVISVVAIGLFYTKQITIFKNQDIGQSMPDYWRTTILCLTAGAFADRVFKAASDRVNQYVGSRTSSGDDKISRSSPSSTE